ncbi:MAG: VIT domain-containing protein [Acidobacteriota bacterium]
MSILPILNETGTGEGEGPGPSLGCMETDRGHLPLTDLDVTAHIEGLIARTTVTQTFINPIDEPLQATYIFPLPDRAAVTSFEMRVGDRVIRAVLKERGEARKAYKTAINEGYRAAIAEEDRPGVFTIRVGNIMPGETATVLLTMIGPLDWSDGEATFRFPLVVAPRYVAGTPLLVQPAGSGTADDTSEVPDASRITPPILLPGHPNPVRLSIAVEVADDGFDAHDFRSSLHAITQEASEGLPSEVKRFAVRAGERVNRDFVFRFKVGQDSLRTSLVIERDAEEGGTFLLSILPPDLPGSSRPRDIAFVLDRSGSMDGWKIVGARRAMGRMIDTLTARDRFTIIAFSDQITLMTDREAVPRFQEASNRNRYHAVEFLAKLTADGGTEMQRPLELALDTLATVEEGRERILVFVTDGQVAGEDAILKSVKSRIGSTRIYTLGVDRAVNEAFLRRLAVAGAGWSEIVETEDRLDEVMDRVHRRVGQVVVRKLEIIAQGAGLDQITPARLPDLYSGSPLFISGRYVTEPEEIVVRGVAQHDASQWTSTISRAAGESTVATGVWARAHIREMEDAYVTSRNKTLEQEIVETSLRFGTLSRFTAYLAVDESEIVNGEGKIVEITQAVDMPDGWGMVMRELPMDRGAVRACAYPPAMRRSKGGFKLDAVFDSMVLGSLKSSLEVNPVDKARALLARLEAALPLTEAKKRKVLLSVFDRLRDIAVALGNISKHIRETLLQISSELQMIQKTRAKADVHDILTRTVAAVKQAIVEEERLSPSDLDLEDREQFWK